MIGFFIVKVREVQHFYFDHNAASPLAPEVLREFGGAQLSKFKTALAELAVARLAPVNAEMSRLLADPSEIDRILADGAGRARLLAAPVMRQVKEIVGFLRS